MALQTPSSPGKKVISHPWPPQLLHALHPSALNLIRFCLSLQLTPWHLSNSLRVPCILAPGKSGWTKWTLCLSSWVQIQLHPLLVRENYLPSVWLWVLIWKMEIKIVPTSGWMNEFLKLVYTYDGILFILRKEGNPMSCYNMDEFWIMPSEISHVEKDKYCWFHLDEVAKGVELIESESRMVAARGWGKGALRSCYLNGIEFQFCKMKKLKSIIAQQCEYT